MTGLFGEKHIVISVLILFSLSIHPTKKQVISANESCWQLFRVIVSHRHIMVKTTVTDLIPVRCNYLHLIAQRFMFGGNCDCSILFP